MYGTVARMRVKPGTEGELLEQARQSGGRSIPGFVAEYVYRSDADSQVYYLAVVFESREAYTANAASPEQDAQYRRLRALLADGPEWHDGEIVYTYST